MFRPNRVVSHHYSLQGVTFRIIISEIIVPPAATDVDMMGPVVGGGVKGIFALRKSLERAIAVAAELLPERRLSTRGTTASAGGRSLGHGAGMGLERVSVSQFAIDGHQRRQTGADDSHVDLDHGCDARDGELLCFGQCTVFRYASRQRVYLLVKLLIPSL